MIKGNGERLYPKSKEKKQLQKVETAVYTTLEKLEQHLKKQEGDEEYIHRIRVHIKHLRAWLRLLKIKTDEIYWKDMDSELRDLAKSLGSARDLQVIEKTIDEFASRAEDEAEQQVLKKLHASCGHEEIINNIDWNSFKQDLQEHIKYFREYFVHVDSASDIRNDLMRHYKKTGKSADTAFAHDHDFERLHKFRKNVKALNYHVGYLNNGFQNQGKKIKKQLNELGELLGRIHDLDILRLYTESLDRRRFDSNDRTVTDRILERELQRLLTPARAISDKIFSLRPENFVRFVH